MLLLTVFISTFSLSTSGLVIASDFSKLSFGVHAQLNHVGEIILVHLFDLINLFPLIFFNNFTLTPVMILEFSDLLLKLIVLFLTGVLL